MTMLHTTPPHMSSPRTNSTQMSMELMSMAQQAARLPDLGAEGACLLAAGKLEEAAAFYQQMLGSDPESRTAHAGLYRAWSGLGNAHRAASHLGRALDWPSVVTLPYRGASQPVPVLLLLSLNACNSLLQRYLNDRIFQTYVLLVELFTEETILPPHRLIVNAVGDADTRSQALAAVERILARSSAQVINPPERVLATGRCRNAQRMGGIPGVLAPRSAEFPRERLMAATAVEELRELGFEFPLLVRSPGFHMGHNFVRVGAAGELGASIAGLPGNDLLVLQYLDGQGADGNTRKYRVLFVGGRLYPVHLAIAKQWKIHYFSADMEDHPEHRAEEARFLNDMHGMLGPAVMNALRQIQETLGLDYGGIDFGLNMQGQVLLYEANATMAVYHPNSDPKWNYRRPAIEEIYAATRDLLLARATGRM
jgi:hypothetical protein